MYLSESIKALIIDRSAVEESKPFVLPRARHSIEHSNTRTQILDGCDQKERPLRVAGHTSGDGKLMNAPTW